MKILIKDGRIIGTATDDYSGPEVFIPAPEGFTAEDLDRYKVVDAGGGKLELTAIVPEKVSRRQAYQQLFLAGMLEGVEAAIASVDDPTQRKLVQIHWESSQEFERYHPTIEALAGQILGLTSTQIDEMFIAAARL